MLDVHYSNDSLWYLIHTKPRQEYKAFEHLSNQSFAVFLPTIGIEKKRGKEISIYKEPLFTQYVFVNLNLHTDNWTPIRSTRGVSNFVMIGGKFAAVPDTYIQALKKESERILPQFSSGDVVVIKDGPLSNLEGIYQESDGNTRARILIELMSTPQNLSIPKNMLKKVA